MLYAILCYDREDEVFAWDRERDAQVMRELGAVTDRLRARGKLGPVARLVPTTAAATVRKGREALVLDGPFAETKEQLLGFYVVDCDSMEEAIAVAKELGAVKGTGGAHEVRPIGFFAGSSVADPLA